MIKFFILLLLLVSIPLLSPQNISAQIQAKDLCRLVYIDSNVAPDTGSGARRIRMTLNNKLRTDDLKVDIIVQKQGSGEPKYNEDIVLSRQESAANLNIDYYFPIPPRAPEGNYEVVVGVKNLGVCEGSETVKIVNVEAGVENRPKTDSTLSNVENNAPFGSVGEIITALIPNLFAIAGMLAFVFLVFGGIRYALARGDMKATDAARGMITNAITGLVVILVVFVIFEIITNILKFTIFGLAPAVSAQTSVDIGSSVKLGGNPISGVFPDIGTFVTSIIGGATTLMGLVFFVLLLWGGLRYMSSRGDEKAAQEARSIITNAVIGLLIVLGAFAIITVIGLFTGQSYLLP